MNFETFVGEDLDQQLDGWLNKVNNIDSKAIGIISPHAGYSYSGPPAAHGFKNLDKSKIKRVFILGPSHHYYLKSCQISEMKYYQTPLGKLTLDQEVISELHQTGEFGYMSKEVDEKEHSIEMQLPYIKKMMEGQEFTIVPILVGSTSFQKEEMYGQMLAPYLSDESNFFVISSDFCHWGKRFDYYHCEKKDDEEIYQSIEKLDRRGMEAIETGNPSTFGAYLKETENTICGRHPIGIFMQMVKASKGNFKTQFVHYAQSNRCRTTKDSSVSYAVGVCSRG
eukprot:TRINITY_DN2359_c0_g1_i1.p1 TRINITY_DN2359_c0_g1~~TRINITY_DN2359_c0_g1_i1.p1  ORF type:complete len:281 (-),score=92.06 TRINITY_DN2359_c0_g1_i1:37-879(-)